MTLLEVVQNQLVRMLARNLEGAPAAAELAWVARVYADDCRERGLSDADAHRVQRAFEILGPRAQRFPTPRDVLDALPPPEPPPALEHQARHDPELVAEHLADLHRVMKSCGLRTPDQDTKR